MARIFFALSIIALLSLIAVGVQGFGIGDYNRATVKLLDAHHRLRLANGLSGESSEREQRQRDFDDANRVLRPISAKASWHRVVGTGATLIALLVSCLSVTYFIGTERWCKEVVDAYKLDPDIARQSNSLKRSCFPWSFGGILILLAMIITGGLCDPFAKLSENSAAWVSPHWIVAAVGTALMAFAFWVQIGFIGAHFELIETVLSEVKRIRAEKGLED